MDDLEITRLCAEAMELGPVIDRGVVYCRVSNYDPLHNDAQAMALVKKFTPLCIHSMSIAWANPDLVTLKFDLNRAICECVAKMLAAEETPTQAVEVKRSFLP